MKNRLSKKNEAIIILNDIQWMDDEYVHIGSGTASTAEIASVLRQHYKIDCKYDRNRDLWECIGAYNESFVLKMNEDADQAIIAVAEILAK